MNEQITSAAELDALPVGWAGIGVDGNIWQRVDARVEWQSLTGGGYTYASDFIRECAPLATLYRPDRPQLVQPSREDVADTLMAHQKAEALRERSAHLKALAREAERASRGQADAAWSRLNGMAVAYEDAEANLNRWADQIEREARS